MTNHILTTQWATKLAVWDPSIATLDLGRGDWWLPAARQSGANSDKVHMCDLLCDIDNEGNWAMRSSSPETGQRTSVASGRVERDFSGVWSRELNVVTLEKIVWMLRVASRDSGEDCRDVAWHRGWPGIAPRYCSLHGSRTEAEENLIFGKVLRRGMSATCERDTPRSCAHVRRSIRRRGSLEVAN